MSPASQHTRTPDHAQLAVGTEAPGLWVPAGIPMVAEARPAPCTLWTPKMTVGGQHSGRGSLTHSLPQESTLKFAP